MDRMGSNCESSNMKWQTTPVRSILDVSGGSLLPLPPRKSVHTSINIAENPLEIFGTASALRKHSGHQVGGKNLKFLQLRKKSNSESTFSQEACQPSLTIFRFPDQSRSSVSVEDVDTERYHSDEDDEFGSAYDHPSTIDGPHESAWHQPQDEKLAASIGAGRHSSAKQNSGRNSPRLGRFSVDLHLTSLGLSRRFGKLDLFRIDKLRQSSRLSLAN